MNCHKVQNLISAYIDCELSGLEMLAVRRHLSECAQCSRDMEAIFAVKRSFGGLRQVRPAEGLAVRICSRLDQVPLPLHEQALITLRSRLTAFPGRLRLAAVGMGAFAMLLMLRSGQIIPGNDTYRAAVPPAMVSSLPDGSPIRFFPTGSIVEPAHFELTPSPEPSTPPWEFTEESERPSPFLGNPGVMLTSYQVPR